MITIFSDTEASVAAAVYAVMSALGKSIKTVVLQFSGNLSVEDILIGNIKIDIGVVSETISNTGMDALVRYQSFSTLTKEHFNMCVTPVLKTRNLLDIVAPPQIESFSKDMDADSQRIQEIITVAGIIYDNVIIVLDNEVSKLAETVKLALGTYEYKFVRGIRQGEKNISDTAAYNEYFLIHDYNSESFFSTKYYRKLLNSANISVFPYNVHFKDACLSGDLLMFLRKNIVVDSGNRRMARKEDVNAEFILQISDFSEKINSEVNSVMSALDDCEDICLETKKIKRTGSTRRIINGENVFIKEIGGIRKKKVVTLDFEGIDSAELSDENIVSNYMYKTNRATFNKLLKIADLHKRSINAEINHIVNNYIHYIEANAALEKRNKLKRTMSDKKVLIS